MNVEQMLFLLTAAGTLTAALMVVRARRLIHAAFWLVAALFGIAVLYILLQATFLAVVQIVVYIGAIAVLFIFAIMLTRRDLRDQEPPRRASGGVALLISLIALSGLTVLILSLPQGTQLPPSFPADLNAMTALGAALLSPAGDGLSSTAPLNEGYALPFEVASVLLLAALVGAAYVATSERGGKSL